MWTYVIQNIVNVVPRIMSLMWYDAYVTVHKLSRLFYIYVSDNYILKYNPCHMS